MRHYLQPTVLQIHTTGGVIDGSIATLSGYQTIIARWARFSETAEELLEALHLEDLSTLGVERTLGHGWQYGQRYGLHAKITKWLVIGHF